MLKNIAIGFLICFAILGSDQPNAVVSGADGNQYKLVKPVQKLANGAISIAEYVRVGDKSGTRYAMRLTSDDTKPSFWKISVAVTES